MFQTFDEVADPSTGAARLKLLRAELARRGLTGFLVPRADEHQGEYVPPSAERLKWLTGFAGSAGAAVVLQDNAAVFVDGRYTLQVRVQVDCAAFQPEDLIANPPDIWLRDKLNAADRLGYDPWLHTVAGVRRLAKACKAAGAELVAVDGNPIDAIWTDRPAPPRAKVTLQPIELAGESAEHKLARLAETLDGRGVDAALLTQPDSIAWTFNIRGADVPHTPLPLSFAILRRDGRPTLFIDGAKLSNEVRDRLEDVADVAEPGALTAAIEALGAEHARVLIDKAWVADALAARVTKSGGTVVEGDDPVILPKALKNAAEIAGTRAAHRRDGAAFARFLAWFDREAPNGRLDEIAVVEALEGFRAGTGELADVSFDSIAGAGPNGAIVHYRVSRDTNRKLDPDSLFLIDSGAQYRDGTTDITRTLAVGRPSAEMAERFTLVLKGHIGIAAARFPVGTTGAQLDSFARAALWAAGLDYDHGTGHGVGSFLSVHEGPQRIAKTGSTPLQPGMILSNEPGYYKTGAYGIRIENLVLVSEPQAVAGGERPMLGFETLTLAPIDRRLIVADLLGSAERAWVDAYHARVRAELTPLVDADTAQWLAAATAPL